jgi:hypothetical protein
LSVRATYATIAWNSAECLVTLASGFVAGGIALVGFGLDSSNVAALWIGRPAGGA